MVKTSKHVRFDEGSNDLEIPTPNDRQLWIDLGRPLPEDKEEASIVMSPTLDSQHTPFPTIYDVPVWVICDHDTLWMIICYCPDRDRVYLKYSTPRTSCSKIKGWKNKFREAYILQIQNNPVVNLSDAEEVIASSLKLIQYDESSTIKFFFRRTATNPEHLGIPSLRFGKIK